MGYDVIYSFCHSVIEIIGFGIWQRIKIVWLPLGDSMRELNSDPDSTFTSA